MFKKNHVDRNSAITANNMFVENMLKEGYNVLAINKIS